jgi:hypothetical protein
MRIQSTVTQVNTIRQYTRTSLRVNGEVRTEASSGKVVRCKHGSQMIVYDVVGDSRLKRGRGREDGRPEQVVHGKTCCLGVRAAIGAKKPSNVGGAKGGRKADTVEGEGVISSRINCLPRLERERSQCPSLQPETECESPRKEALGRRKSNVT